MSNVDTTQSLIAVASAIRSGQTTVMQIARSTLDRHARQAGLGAMAGFDADYVLRQASVFDRAFAGGDRAGPLHGVPLVIKDNIHVAGLPNTAGTPSLGSFIPAFDASAVVRLRAAGALIVGKASMHELAMGWTGQNPHFGTARNPHDSDRMAGGSSGGTAAALAAGIALGGLGTDTNGSIRIPSAFCGVAGLRPTHGYLPMDGITPLAPSLDTVGPMARTVADLAVLYQVMADRMVPRLADAEGIRLGLVQDYFLTVLSQETGLGFAAVCDRLKALGVQLLKLELPELADLVAGSVPAIIGHESYAALESYLAEVRPGMSIEALAGSVGNDLRGALRRPDTESQQAYRAALHRREKLRARLGAVFAEHGIDALFYPTTPMPAPLLQQGPLVSPAPGVIVDGALLPARIAFARNVSPASLAGLPSLTVPITGASGLPLGLQLDGWVGSDARLLAIGRAVEAAVTH